MIQLCVDAKRLASLIEARQALYKAFHTVLVENK